MCVGVLVCVSVCVCVRIYVTSPWYMRIDLGDMGWLRWVGSLKLKVSFAEYCLFCRALLQKRPIILWSLLIVATPYHRDVFLCSVMIWQQSLFYYLICWQRSLSAQQAVIFSAADNSVPLNHSMYVTRAQNYDIGILCCKQIKIRGGYD